MSYTRGDFYVSAVKTGLRDNQIMIPLRTRLESRRTAAETWGISFVLVSRGCHNGTPGNRFHCMERASFPRPESARWGAASQKAGEQGFHVQEFRTRLSELSVYSSSKNSAFRTPVPEALPEESDAIPWS